MNFITGGYTDAEELTVVREVLIELTTKLLAKHTSIRDWEACLPGSGKARAVITEG